jgi:hypothetical protein
VPDFVLHRDYALRSMSGHMINFKKGDPTWVPNECVKEAVAIGAAPVDGPVEVLDPEVHASIVPEGQERKDLIFAAFEDMEAKNEREEWTASGMPTSKALEKILGFEVDSKERNTLWIEYRAAKSEG